MRHVLLVPDDGPWFAGHFPGRPILPGVAALTLASEALACGPLAGIEHARFRSTIAPGESLALDAKRQGGDRIRVAVLRAGVGVLSATLACREPASGVRVVEPTAPPFDAPPLDALLPHRPPMRFVTAVLAVRADGADCAARIPPDCALVRGVAAPALAVIEAAAQTAAVWEALRRRGGGPDGGPREGYLVALRDVPADVPLVARVRLTAVAMPLTQYHATVTLAGEPVMDGTIGTVLA